MGLFFFHRWSEQEYIGPLYLVRTDNDNVRLFLYHHTTASLPSVAFGIYLRLSLRSPHSSDSHFVCCQFDLSLLVDLLLRYSLYSQHRT